MADNITLNTGSGGSTLRTDDDGTAHWQYVKLAYGADDTQTIVGSTSSNPLPVALSDTDNTVLDNIQTAVELIDNAISGNEMQVDLVSADVTNAGTFAVQISDTSFAVADGNALGEGVLIQGDDGTDRKNINVDATTGDVQVDVTNTVTVDLGANNDVTIDASSVVVTDDAAFTLGTGTGIMMMGFAGTQSVNSNDAGAIAMETDGAIHIHDGGNTITVDGTVTANPASGTIDTVTTVTTVTALTDITGGVVPGTDAADLGKAEDAAHSTGDTGVYILGVRDDTLGVHSGADGDYESFHMTSTGRLYTSATIDAALPTGSNTIGVVDLGATDNAVLDQIAAAVEIMDDWDETNRAAVNLIASQTAVAGGTGTDAANVLRVSLATDIALPAGTNAIGKLSPNSGVDIGDVDVLSIAAGTNRIGGVMLEADAVATGTSTFYDNDLDETKIEVTDNPNVRIYSIHAINTTAAPLYLQLFDLDADNVTVGTTAPTNQYIIPGNADSDGAGFILNFGAAPKQYTTGFTVACTTDSEGSAAPGANACHVNIEYISAA